MLPSLDASQRRGASAGIAKQNYFCLNKGPHLIPLHAFDAESLRPYICSPLGRDTKGCQVASCPLREKGAHLRLRRFPAQVHAMKAVYAVVQSSDFRIDDFRTDLFCRPTLSRGPMSREHETGFFFPVSCSLFLLAEALRGFEA